MPTTQLSASVGVSKWLPEPVRRNQAAILLRMGTSVYTLACFDRREFFAGEACSEKTGNLASVYMHDTGRTRTAAGRGLEFAASTEVRFMHPLIAPDIDADVDSLDGVGIWPASAGSSLVVTKLGAQELMERLKFVCEMGSYRSKCSHVKELTEPRVKLDATELAAIMKSIKRLPRAELQEVVSVADVQLDGDSELERVYDVSVEVDRTEDIGIDEPLERVVESMVVVRDGAKFSTPQEYLVMAVTDLNGDGRAELVMSDTYFEGVIYTFVAWSNGKWLKLAQMTEGT